MTQNDSKIWHKLRSRFPDRSDQIKGFALCAFPVFVWALFNFLYNLPALTMHATILELVGVAAYVFAEALIESILLLGILNIICFVLPRRFFHDTFVASSAALIWLTAAWSIWVILFFDYRGAIPFYGRIELIGFAIYFASLILVWLVVQRLPRVKKTLEWLVERVQVLTYLYASLGAAGIIIVLLRNLL